MKQLFSDTDKRQLEREKTSEVNNSLVAHNKLWQICLRGKLWTVDTKQRMQVSWSYEDT